MKRLNQSIVLLLVVVAAVLPYALHSDVEFKTDDLLLVARGVETGMLEGLWRNFSRPFADTWTIEFYRPLFTWAFCVEGNLFGGDAFPYYVVNMFWHALAAILGYLFLRRFMGAQAAFFSTLLFCANPWAANNVAWMVGQCTIVATVAITLGTLLYWRYLDRGARGLPWATFSVMAVGIFYRETVLFLPFLVFLIDMFDGRRDARALLRWIFLSAPFAVYLLVKYLVVGAWIGGYARLAALHGPAPESAGGTSGTPVGSAILDILAPGRGDAIPDFGGLRIFAIVLLACLFLLGLTGSWRRKETWILLLFALAHAVPLLIVDPVVHANSAQRWYTVMWALGGFYGALVAGSKFPRLGGALILGLVVCGGFRLEANLDQYEKVSRFAREVQKAIAESPEDDVFVYGVRINFDSSPFYAVGLGQTQLPPFVPAGEGKAVYPIFEEQRFAADEFAQTPVVADLALRKIPCSVLKLDCAKLTIERPTPDVILQLAATRLKLGSLPQLQVKNPADVMVDNATTLNLDCAVPDMDRLDIFLVCPVAQLHLRRYRSVSYANGGFTSDGRFREDLSYMLEFASLMPGAAGGRCWLWVCGYASETDSEPKAISKFYELWSKVPQGRPE